MIGLDFGGLWGGVRNFLDYDGAEYYKGEIRKWLVEQIEIESAATIDVEVVNEQDESGKHVIQLAQRSNDNNADTAMLGRDNPEYGGIDFNPNELNLSQEGGEISFTVDNAMLQSLKSENVQGITPVLINITPITNFAPLLGLSNENIDALQLSRQQ